MLGYALDYLALVASDTDAVCRFLGEALALPCNQRVISQRSVPFFAVGQAEVAIFAQDDDYLDAPRLPGLHHMALKADQPAEVARRHGLLSLEAGAGPDARAYIRLDPTQTCGIRTRLIEPAPAALSPSPSSSSDTIAVAAASTRDIERIDHLGVASTDLSECVRLFADTLGCEVESKETDIEIRQVTESFVSDKYGAVYHSRPPEVLGGLRAVFITIGDCDLEILADYDPVLAPQTSLGEGAGNTKGDQSAIAKFVARRGPGLAHLAFVTRDIDKTLAGLSDAGWRLIDPAGRPGGRGSRIGFVHPSNFGGGLLMHFVEPWRGDK